MPSPGPCADLWSVKLDEMNNHNIMAVFMDSGRLRAELRNEVGVVFSRGKIKNVDKETETECFEICQYKGPGGGTKRGLNLQA